MVSLHEGHVTLSFPPSLRSATTMSAESTRKLLGNLFELQDLGAQDLKDIAEPVRARVLRASSVESRFEAFEYADQEVCDICTPLAVTVRCVEIGRPPSDLYPSWSAAGGVGARLKLGRMPERCS